MADDFRWKWVVLPGLSLFSILLVMLLSWFPLDHIFQRLELMSYDWRMRLKVQQRIAERKGGSIDDVVIIDIDEKSVEKLGRVEQWPRNYHARLLQKIQGDNPAAIGFNILLTEPDEKNRKGDDSLRMVIEKAGNVFLGLSFSMANPDAFLLPMKNAPTGFKSEKFSYKIVAEESLSTIPRLDRFDGKYIELYNQAAGIGFINFLPRLPDEKHIIGEMPLFIKYADRYYPSLSLAILIGITGIRPENLRIAADGKIKIRTFLPDSQMIEMTIPTDSDGYLLIDYQGPVRSFRTIPYLDILEGRIPKSFFRGKIVLIGSTADKNYDWHPVPFQTKMPAIEIRANILYSILNHSYLRRVGSFGSFFGRLFLVIFLAFIISRLNLWRSLLFLIITLSLYIVFAFLLFVYLDIWIELIAPFLTFSLASCTILCYRYAIVLNEQRLVKKNFAYHLAPAQIHAVVKNHADLELGGKKTTATIFFSDINNFAALVENLSPEDLVKILNEYHAVMTDIILKYDGYLDKYQGDNIMAIFGAPLPLENHAKRACLVALEMQYRLAQLRVKWELENKPQMAARIGIHLGAIVAGNIGGEKNFNYTAIGENVNLASRLEAINKVYGTAIVISEDVYELVKETFTVREIDFLLIKGRRKPLAIYELIAKKEDRLDENTQQLLEYYQKGLTIYRHGNWESAFNEFRSALKCNPKDGPSREFLHRCIVFIDQKRFVPDNWDGVFETKSV